ncbi:MAG: 5'-methylthioadenosine/S-adenosylhomocysteine nucleosidase [Paracoccus denitrificans]|nr:MAG: 5'-methylthioadenosine/S-adenosylhomocysteine nucleosidase [Paracoccus denitrificans]PZO84421.1 MAG: 5'-methylthioadenosine/S-adenosylhomocysteine nucleosidase [Paracoccus denitrificans]
MTDFRIETFGTTRVLFVMAVASEYGPALQARCRPLMTGVGPIEAAVVVTRTLAELGDARPDLVVSLGSAGSAVLDHTRVYQADTVSWRDIDASALGYPAGQVPFLGLARDVPLGLRIPGVPTASLSTGGNVVSGAAYAAIPAEMVDMETFAVMRACNAFGVPLVALRGISDGQNELTGVHDWTEYLHIVDANLAEVVDKLTEALRRDGIAALS